MALWGGLDNLANAPKWLTPSFTFDGTGANKKVLASADTITLENHGIQSGTKVFVTSASNDQLGANVSDVNYAQAVDGDTIKLYGTYNGSAFSQLRQLTEAGTGHTLQVIPTAVDAGEATGTAPAVSVFFVDAGEAANNRDKGMKTPGWYKYVTYTDTNSVVRKKAELLCAFGESDYSAAVGDTGVTGTAGDEDGVVTGEQALLAIGTISSQATATVDLAGDAAISVSVGSVTVTPSGGTISYTWQISTDGGFNWTDITSGGDYVITGATGASSNLAVANTSTKAGEYYRVAVDHDEANRLLSHNWVATQS